MYELVSLYFPFEKQNLMSSQIEKLVIDGERPPLQNRVSEREGGRKGNKRLHVIFFFHFGATAPTNCQ